MTAISVAFGWPLVAAAWVVACCCFLSSLHVLQHRTGAYGFRNWLIMFASALLFTFALFTSTAVSLLSLTLSTPSNPSLPLTVDPALLFIAFFLPFIFLLFGLFLAGHPDSHRYLRLPLGTLAIAAGTTVTNFLMMFAVHTLGSFELVGGYVAGVVGVGMVGVGAVMYGWLYEQRRVKVSMWATFCVSVVLAVLVVVMHMLALGGMQWTYDNSQSLASPLHPLVAPLVVFAMVAFLALVASVGVSYYVRRKEASRSQCFTLSAFIMDDHHRVLVTATGALPSVRIENVHLGQGALSHQNKDFLLLLSTSTHWADAFVTLHQLTIADTTTTTPLTPTPTTTTPITNTTTASTSPLVYGKFLHAAVQLAHNLQLPLPQLGLLYRQPLDDRLVLVSRAVHAGRLSDVGGYRWVAKEVVDGWMRREHGCVGLRGVGGHGGGGGGSGRQEKMLRVLGEEGVGDGDEYGWVRELETYHALYELDVGQQLVASETIDIVIPGMAPIEIEMVQTGVVDTKAAAPSPRGRSTTLPSVKKSMAVTPLSAIHTAVPTDDEAMRDRGASTCPTLAEHNGPASATQPQSQPSPTHARSATSPATLTTTDAHTTITASATAAADDSCRLYVGMFLAKITGQQVSVAVQRRGPSHMVPCVRMRLPASEPKEELSDEEREWMGSVMADERLAALSITQHFHSFPRNTLLTSSSPLSRFQSALYVAVSELGTLLGGGKHLTFNRLLSVHPVSVSNNVQLLMFCETVMTPHFPLGYDRMALTFMPAKVFESLHCGRWRHCQPKDWISRALLSTARSTDKRRAYLDTRATFLNAADTTTPHQPVAQPDSPKTPPTAHARSGLTSHTGSRLLRSVDVSVAPSVAGSVVGSRAASRRGSRVGVSGYEMRERVVMGASGESVVVMEVVDLEAERAKEERRRRRKEKKERRAAGQKEVSETTVESSCLHIQA